ncbi:MAG: outer membrane beta-barrel protein [Thalassotalea sp.]|nr:outer membrane beta-barrel protein [Thalassotalea sp.]MDG2394505.1 outer membrane beta-barrel protein [Thalassotalea sp.]
MKKCLLSLIIALGFSQSAIAANETDKEQWQLTVFVGERTSSSFEDDDELDEETPAFEVDFLNEASAGIILGWDYDYNSQGELLFSHSNTEFDEGGDVALDDMEISISYLHLGGNVMVSDGKLPVYISAGIGIAHLAPSDSSLDSETKPSANLGVGVRFNFNDNLSLRLDARGYGTFFDSDGYIFCSGDTCKIRTSSSVWFQADFTAGLSYLF